MKQLLFVLFTLLAGFAQAENTEKWFNENRTYVHHLFIDQKACDDYQSKGFWINCTQTLNLSKNGSAEVMVTDIINSGTYEISNGKITVRTEGGDSPPEMVFTIDRTGRNLILDGSSSVWELEQR